MIWILGVYEICDDIPDSVCDYVESLFSFDKKEEIRREETNYNKFKISERGLAKKKDP